MSKSLEALERIGKTKYQTTVADITGFERITISVKQDNKKDYQIIEKSLKALEILKEVGGVSWERILKVWLKIEKLTQEEFDSLREVLL